MTFVVDASVVVKWVVEETGTAASLALRRDNRLVAPDLVVAECANILWKKARRGELTGPQAKVAARLLERSGIELIPMQGFRQMRPISPLNFLIRPTIAFILR